MLKKNHAKKSKPIISRATNTRKLFFFKKTRHWRKKTRIPADRGKRRRRENRTIAKNERNAKKSKNRIFILLIVSVHHKLQVYYNNSLWQFFYSRSYLSIILHCTLSAHDNTRRRIDDKWPVCVCSTRACNSVIGIYGCVRACVYKVVCFCVHVDIYCVWRLSGARLTGALTRGPHAHTRPARRL